MEIHVVQPNETITTIANQYGVSTQRLIFDNELYNPERLVIGQALLVLFPARIHQVVQGDTLYSISREYQISVSELVRNNPYLIEGGLQVGESIVLAYEGEGQRPITTNGYVYPFVDMSVLEQTLPYLTTLSIFSYGFTMNGDLVPTDDEEILEMAINYGVGPVLVLTPHDAAEAFNNVLVSQVAQNPAVQDRLIEQLVVVMREKNYVGVDSDFEFIQAADRIGYANFIQKLNTRMNEEGFFVSVALAPKMSADQPGLLYEGIDYALLGTYADSVLLMTYEWGYTFGPPMAVAPINKVREILDYAVTVIPNEKIDLGIPNYGYDWALPFVRGTTRATAIGNTEAIQIAIANNSVIQFDEVAQSPFFTYALNGVDHIVWFEDARSILAKLSLVTEYDLRGVGYWQLMKYFRQNWLLVNLLFSIL